MSAIHGRNLVAGRESAAGSMTFRATNPADGSSLEPEFHEATGPEVDMAFAAASAAFEAGRRRPAADLAAFLERIAAELESRGAALVAQAMAETGLPEARLVGERGRTVGQLRMFAALVREGSWVDARIDPALPDRKPLPRPDLRRMLVPIGPVVVFGASNFPLAFSAAGGDTASALAAGNPVVVKAHPAHPGTSELAGHAIVAAAAATGMPPGIFSLLQGPSPELGRALVTHRVARAVGFTGSLGAGRALYDAAAARPEPIPVFAEMGSVNPVLVFPDALRTRGPEIARGLAQSTTLGVGQFCTNPGLVVGLQDEGLEAFVAEAGQAIDAAPSGVMLHAGIAARFLSGVRAWRGTPGVAVVGEGPKGKGAAQGGAALFRTTDRVFLENHHLREEVFGPSSLVVACANREALEQVVRTLAGQLTVTVHATERDLAEFAPVLDRLAEKAGRVVFGGFPTGVEVAPAMQHGGPYPATTDSRSTSVGTAAIFRFARPVCYQNAPASVLPPELLDANPRGIWRLVDGAWTRDPLGK
jgi:NADP-dependent aldehyde dehydrogenase